MDSNIMELKEQSQAGNLSSDLLKQLRRAQTNIKGAVMD